MKKNGVTSNIVKAEIGGDVFIRVTNTNSCNEIININIYKGIKNSEKLMYKKVFPNELDINLVYKLQKNDIYTKLNDLEKNKFLKSINETIELFYKTDKLDNNTGFLQLNNTCNILYMLSKSDDDVKYLLSELKTDELGLINGYILISQKELPYIIIDILQKNNFNEMIINISNGIIVKVIKQEDKYLALIIEIQDNDKGVLFSIIDAFTIIETNDEFIVITDMDNEFAIQLNDKTLKEYADKIIAELSV